MRVLCLCLFVLLPGIAVGRCAPFDLLESFADVPYVLLGVVTYSNKEELLAQGCDPEVCTHRFSIEVKQVLKGDVKDSELHFSYDFVQQRPEIALFAVGDEYIFALSEVTEGGMASLLGTTCGRAGISADRIDELN